MAYVDELQNLANPQALERACHVIAMTWTQGWRPPIATIIEQYNREVSRAAAERQPMALGAKYPTFEQGVQIAWEAYCGEVRRMGREPDRKVFEKWLPR